MSDAGLVPLLGLAEQTRLPELIAGKVSITSSRIKSGVGDHEIPQVGGFGDHVIPHPAVT